MDEVALLIFDEAHHTFEKHPYNLIMHEFYHPLPRDARPRVFGMTASPLNTKSSMPEVVINAIRLLEQHLDATVVTVKERNEVEMHAPVAKQELVRFSLPTQQRTYSASMLRAIARLKMAHSYAKYDRCCIFCHVLLITCDDTICTVWTLVCTVTHCSYQSRRSMQEFQTACVRLRDSDFHLQLDHLDMRTTAQRISSHLQQVWDTTEVCRHSHA